VSPQMISFGRFLLAVALLFTGVASGVAHGAAAHAAVSSPMRVRWGHPVFIENFNGTSLNTRRWHKFNDPWGTWAARHSGDPLGSHRTRSSVIVHGGMLNLVGHWQRPYGFVSGGVGYNFYQTYGRWVIRFRADRGAGYEPVVLLRPVPGTWPRNGEIDLAEVKFPSRRGAGEYVHLGSANTHVGHHIPSSVSFARWHVLAVDWLPGHITFWLDGRRQWTVLPSTGRRDYIPGTPFHLDLQNDQGCANHRCRPNSSTPRRTTMQIDWVKIYAAPGRG
jgi:glycosyl hydrolase family 16